ncbi:MAG: CRISPR-associated protein Cas5 [Bacteroidales bacterium]|nr:CRISPR-associated protein Cas5 [Bacteroidales bacterium]
MQVLSFDIEGKFAHFRKYFANNTAFSFSLPPRTTITGIIAGAIGIKKDSYYENFSSQNLKIGINILTPVKKTFHRLNFLMVKGDSDFRGRQKHIQTPFEIVSGINPQTDMVKYRIFLAPSDNGTTTYEDIRSVFLSNKFMYSPTLGTANFIARFLNIMVWNNVEEIQINNERVSLNSAGISDNISEILFEKTDDFRFNMIEEELMPADFKANNDREVIKMNRILFTTGGIPLDVKLNGNVFVLHDNNQRQTIQFLE